MWKILGVVFFSFLIIAFTSMIQIIATGLILEIAAKAISKNYSVVKFFFIFVLMVLIGVLALLSEILIWSFVVFWTGNFTEWSQAVSFTADKFTTLGSMGPMPQPWALLGPIIAINGIIMFAIMAGSLIVVLTTFYYRELERKGEI